MCSTICTKVYRMDRHGKCHERHKHVHVKYSFLGNKDVTDQCCFNILTARLNLAFFIVALPVSFLSSSHTFGYVKKTQQKH